jgi:maltose/maltodextrin transport system substrate-binding protein/arabinogalactan oligomer/maltooligosaccharide transport system substrate-binding protein
MQRQVHEDVTMKKLSLLLIALVLLGAGFARAQDRPDLLIWADGTRAPALQALVTQFSEDYGVTVEVQEQGMGEIRSNIAIAGPAGEGPDIFIGANDWVGELVNNGAIVPLDLGDLAADFTPASLNLFTYNGELYGMPYTVENVAFFRNTELVPEAPTTWDDVKAITEELVSSGTSEYGFMLQTTDAYHFFPVQSAFGGYIFGTTTDGQYDASDVGLTSEGTLASGSWLNEMAAAGYIPEAVDYDVMHSMFETGQSAMMISGPWALPRIRQSGVPYAISSFPTGPGGDATPFSGGQAFMISAFSENQLLAEEFLLGFMATPESMLAMYEVDPRPPAFAPTLELIEDPDMQAFIAAGANAVPQPAFPGMSSIWGAWANALQFIIQQDAAPEQALGDAQAQIEEIIASGGAPVVTSTSGDTPPADGPSLVSIPGSLGMALGCAADWTPECENGFLSYSAANDLWLGTFTLPAGAYEYKAALDGTWDVNYGANAENNGANIALSLDEETAVTFVYDHKTNWIADSVNHPIATVPGSYQAAFGCAADWAPECLRSWLQDPDGDGVYTFTTTAIPAGDYEAKVALNMGWDVNYGVNGELNGANIAFNVPADGAEVTFSFDSSTNVLSVSAGG